VTFVLFFFFVLEWGGGEEREGVRGEVGLCGKEGRGGCGRRVEARCTPCHCLLATDRPLGGPPEYEPDVVVEDVVP
jgi:hypothetical protein